MFSLQPSTQASLNPATASTQRLRVFNPTSGIKGFYLLSELTEGSLREAVSVVGVATDNPKDPICRPHRRFWSHGYTETERLLVSEVAKRHGIPVYLGDVYDPNFMRTVQDEWRPDVILSSVFGQRIPNEIISVAKVAAWNLHPAGEEWPSYRGGRPYEQMLAEGRDRFWIVLHELDEEFDGGRLVARSKPIFIPPGASVKNLHKLSAVVSAMFAAEQLTLLLNSRRLGESEGVMGLR